MNNIVDYLLELKDDKYAMFISALTPSIFKDRFIGVRAPLLKQLAKTLSMQEINDFLHDLPHFYFDENMLHSVLLSNIKDYQSCIEKVQEFLPYIDNWAVCDTIKPKVFKKNKDDLMKHILLWIKSNHTYTIRFAISMLMTFFLDDDYKKEYLDIPLTIKSDDYYVKMMIAWFYATSLAKHYDDTISYLLDNKLDKWIHNKTIQKAIESYRINNEDKKLLRTLKK
ncbi:MAG: DNA alkylation repair protein [Erysipelotrichaceae bacterium]|nr:DNA alkylation repair protein [Erysipelotrichaceae bacterium]